MLPALFLCALLCLSACGSRNGSASQSAVDAAGLQETGSTDTEKVVGSESTAGDGEYGNAAADAESNSAAAGGESKSAAAGGESEDAATGKEAESAAADGGTGSAAPDDGSESASAFGESESAAMPELVVTKHKQEGKHMVTAGGLTISVPTTFEGLEMEGAEFEGDQVIVRAGRGGSCRVKYRGAFNSIKIKVHNNRDYDMAVRDCTVCGIEIGSQEPDPELTLYGIPMGATRQQIADVYGEPFSKTFDDENHMSNMVYQFGTDIYSNQVVMIIFRDKRAVSASYDDFDQVVN